MLGFRWLILVFRLCLILVVRLRSYCIVLAECRDLPNGASNNGLVVHAASLPEVDGRSKPARSVNVEPAVTARLEGQFQFWFVHFRVSWCRVSVAGIFAPAGTVVGLFEGRGLPKKMVSAAGFEPAPVSLLLCLWEA